MLVRALCLRCRGRRLPVETLRSTPPYAGRLRVEPELTRRPAPNHARMALLLPLDNSVDPLVKLHGIRLLTINGRGLVIAGVEEQWSRKQRSDYRQALWCWPIDPSELVVVQDATDRDEEAEQVLGATSPRPPPYR
jgi:hypothetical protein